MSDSSGSWEGGSQVVVVPGEQFVDTSGEAGRREGVVEPRSSDTTLDFFAQQSQQATLPIDQGPPRSPRIIRIGVYYIDVFTICGCECTASCIKWGNRGDRPLQDTDWLIARRNTVEIAQVPGFDLLLGRLLDCAGRSGEVIRLRWEA